MFWSVPRAFNRSTSSSLDGEGLIAEHSRAPVVLSLLVRLCVMHLIEAEGGDVWFYPKAAPPSVLRQS